MLIARAGQGLAVSISPLPVKQAMLSTLLLLWALPSDRVYAEEGSATPMQLAVLGDSLSTGAGTHPALAFDTLKLWDVFSGRISLSAKRADLPTDLGALAGTDELAAPRRLWPSPREFYGGPDWAWRHWQQAVSRTYLDTGAYSWGYLTGLLLAVPPAAVALAGEDGARILSLSRHVDRVLAAGDQILPRRLLIMYTGNDLCGAVPEQITSPTEFSAQLTSGLEYIRRNGRPAAASGTDVYVLSYLGILQLLTSEDILNKKITAFGSNTTCRELRANGYRPADGGEAMARTARAAGIPWYFQLFMPPNPAAFCQTLFGSGKGREATVNTLANHIRAYRDKQQAVVQAAARTNSDPALRLHLINDTAALKFTADDIAGDCFHLSVAGQAKVARATAAAITRIEGSSAAKGSQGGLGTGPLP